MIDLTPEISEVIALIIISDTEVVFFQTELEEYINENNIYTELIDVYLDGKFVESTQIDKNKLALFLHKNSVLSDILGVENLIKQFFEVFDNCYNPEIKPKYLGYNLEVAKALTY